MSYFFHYDPKNLPCYRNISETCEHRNSSGESIVPGGGFIDQCNVATSFIMQSDHAFSKESSTPYVPIPRDFIALSRQPERNPNIVLGFSDVERDPGICKRTSCGTKTQDKMKQVCFSCHKRTIDSVNHNICE